jgi:hypothetical protein
MGQLTAKRIVDAVTSLLSSTDATDKALVRKFIGQKKVEAHVTDGGTAGTAQTETFVWENDTGADMYVTAAKVTFPVAVASNGSNYASVFVYKRTSAGASQTAIGTADSSATSYTAFVPAALTLTAANVLVPAGSGITVAVTKTGTGVAIAAATSQARVEVQLEPAA